MPATLDINFQSLKQLLTNNKTQIVLEHLEEKLNDTEYIDYYNEIILISNSFQRLKRSKRIDILNFQDANTKANQINDALISLLDDLADGRAFRKVEEVKIFPFWKIAVFLGIGTIGILGILGGVTYYLLDQKDGNQNTTDTWQCPNYSDQNKFKVLVLPFHDMLTEDLPRAPHKAITANLSTYCTDEALEAQVNRLLNDDEVKSLATHKEALEFTTDCDPDMIVWGSAIPRDNSLSLSTKFTLAQNLDFNIISQSETLGSLDTILPHFQFESDYQGATTQIKLVLKSLLDFRSERYSLFPDIQDLEDAGDDNSIVLLNYMKAQSQISQDKKNEAIASYSKIIDLNPTSAIAINNRAFLNLEQERKNEALTDFNSLVNLNKAGVSVYVSRAKINEELEDYSTAKKDLEEARSLSKDDDIPELDEKIRKIDAKIELEKERNPIGPVVTDNVSILNSSDRNSLINQSRSDNKLGNYIAAEHKSTRVLKTDPNNNRAILELIKAQYHKNPKVTISDLQKIPELKNIDLIKLKTYENPIVTTIIQNEKVVNFRNKSLLRANKLDNNGE